jgi:hypothetical protein
MKPTKNCSLFEKGGRRKRENRNVKEEVNLCMNGIIIMKLPCIII